MRIIQSLSDVPYKIGDTVTFVGREVYTPKAPPGTKGTVIDIQEGIYDTPYSIVKTDKGDVVSSYYYRWKLFTNEK